MPEYLGYQGRPKPISWLEIAKGAVTDINAIEADRQKQREALEKSADDLVTASKEYKPGQSGSFNGLVLNAADRVRSTTLDLKKQLMSGQITPTDYKARVGRMSEDWKYFGEFAKSYNDIINKGVEYINSPDASKLGEFFLDKQSKLSDLANKQVVVDPSTYGVVMTDPDTGMVVDFKSALMPENQRPPKLDVMSEVERFTKGLGETSKYVNGIWTTSPILKDANEYQKAKANFTKSLMQSPRGAASILADYVGGYEFYETEQQKKEIEAAGGKAIQLVSGPNGIATPKLTKTQEDEARAVLDRLVDSRVDVEKEQPRPVETTRSSGSGSVSGGGASNQSLIMDYAEYGAQNPVFATAILKARPMPDDPSAFVEKVELGSDGRYRFYTYGFSEPSEYEKKKGFRPKATKSIVTKAVNKEAASSIMARMLENSQSVNKNEAWNQGVLPSDYDNRYVRPGRAYTPSTQTTNSISGGNVR
jgi:hypothetical protein